jgi:hypothetical protein
MADENTNGAGPSIEERASGMGWKPREDFQGDPKGWVDATEYVRRGEEVLPIVQATNRRLTEKLSSAEQRLMDLERINRANSLALEELQTSNREQTVQNTERSIEQIEAGIAEAREAGNVQDELALLREHHVATDRLIKAKTAPQQQQQQPPNGGGQPDLTKTPAFQQFLTDNPWFNSDSVMRAAAVQLQLDMVGDGRISQNMDQAARLSLVAKEVRKRFNQQDNGRSSGPNRVEGGGGGAGSGGGGKSYNDLPEEAKAACDKAARRLQFGANKRYKDEAAWRQSYAQTYFNS